MEKYFQTKETLEAYKKKLKELYTRLQQVRKNIGEAREKGDLRENAEYKAACNEKSLLEEKIKKIREELSRCYIIDKEHIDTSRVGIMNKVYIKNRDTDKSTVLHIVPPDEVDFKQKKISFQSPVARGLMGKKVGEEVSIKIPTGIINLLIEKIEV